MVYFFTLLKRISKFRNAIVSSLSVVFALSAQVPIPSAPVLTYPLNNQTDVWALSGLSWNESPWATLYTIQVSPDSNFNIKSMDTTLTTNFTGVQIHPATTYYWRVNAENSMGVSPWSATWRFTTKFYSVDLKSPQKYQTNVSITPELKWDSVYNAQTYWVQVSTDSSFTTSIINDSLVPNASKIIGPLLPNTIYYWRVNYKNNSGKTGIWSGIWAFATASSSSAISQDFSSPGFGLVYSRHVIKYVLPATLNVSLKVLDLQGKIVWHSASTAHNAGYYSKNFSNSILRPGQYFLEFKAGAYSAIRKISVID